MSYTSSLLMWLHIALSGAGTTTALAQTTEAHSATIRRVKVPETQASALVAEKKTLKYPDAARSTGTKGSSC